MRPCFFLLSLLLLVASCSDGLLSGGEAQAPEACGRSAFTYAALLSSDQWNSCTSFKQRMQLCQIPDSMLPALTTAELVELCATHPLNPVCYAYNNPMDGAKVIMRGFNGFAELQKRTDAAAEVLKFYAGVDFANVEQAPYPITLNGNGGKQYSASNMTFMELMIASGWLPSLYADTERVSELDRLSAEKYEQKVSRNDVFSAASISQSLMIQAGIALKAKQLSTDERNTLQGFYDKGGMAEVQSVSKILFVNH